MATPQLIYRKDLIVMADMEASATPVYKNWCGATGISLVINNEVSEQTVADCDDWSLPVTVIRAYGAQSVTATVNASLTKAGRDKLLRAVKAQKEIPIRFHMVGAIKGEVQYIDGIALLPSLSFDNIGSPETSAIVGYSLSISFKNGVTFTDVP